MDHLIYLQGDEDIMKQKSMDTLAAQMEDFFPVRDVDHLEFYVGNAKQSSYYLARAFGFKIVAYSGLETGNREKGILCSCAKKYAFRCVWSFK